MDKIIELEINNFEKCNNIWNMDKNIDHKNKIYNDLVSGNRKTFVYVKDNEYIAISYSSLLPSAGFLYSNVVIILIFVSGQ